ncbi:MAG: hypothetical protein WC947_09600 [Elusimicrobiota bacterium]
MKTEIGEYIVGAYLKVIKKCDFIGYNVRPPGGGIKGLGEMDVVGLNFEKKIAYICEVTTHILGLRYGNYKKTIKRIKEKHQRQREYAKTCLKDFREIHFMFWSPRVPKGSLCDGLKQFKKLELIINKEYTESIDELIEKAGKITNDMGNPFFRSLQILERLRR